MHLKNTRYAFCRWRDTFYNRPNQISGEHKYSFKKIGAISGLHIYTNKSEIYPIYLEKLIETTLKHRFNYKWTSSNLKYLGINTPLKCQNLYNENFLKTHQEVKRKVEEWNAVNLSWPDRIDTIKSFIFPKFLFFI